VHTCPNCGKDSDAGMSEPCPHCGFDPMAAAEATTTTPSGDQPIGVPLPVPGDGGRRSGFWAWRVIGSIVIVIAIGVIGLIGGSSTDHTGPSADEVENALIDSGAKHRVAVTVSCPESIQDTPVGSPFTCTATNQHGDSRTVTVINRQDSFAWNPQPFFELRRLERQSG
jgi:hypothetical protein